jgi:L-fuculose-phosphate aldolase
MLGCLSEHDLVETGITRNNRATPLASTELAIHRAIYSHTPARAIVHAHPPHAIALSLTDNEVAPCDHEGFSLLPRTPILGQGAGLKLEELVDDLVKALREFRIVLVYGHGSFAVGQLLEEAYQCTTALEESCRIICLLRSLEAKNPPLVR